MRHRRKQSGGMFQLSKVRRDLHFWRCQQVVCKYGDIQKDIAQLLNDVYEATQHELNEFKKVNPAAAAALQEKFNIIKATAKPLSQEMLNVKSLQCVIIMTEICRAKMDPEKFLSEYPIPRIKNDYNKIMNIPYENYDILISLIKTIDNIKSLLDPKYILVLLGEMSLLEIVSTYANRQYLIGITTDMAYADGFHFSPLEFVHHDVVHAENREYGFGNYGPDLERLKSFTDYLEKLPSEEDIYKISLALFMITHEIYRNEYILMRPEIPDDFNFTGFSKPVYLDDIAYWKNEKAFGGLLTEEMRTKGTKEEIFGFLDECFILLKDTWNAYFKTPEGKASINKNAQAAINQRRRVNRNTKIKGAGGAAAGAGGGGAAGAGPVAMNEEKDVLAPSAQVAMNEEDAPAPSAPPENIFEEVQVDPRTLQVGKKYRVTNPIKRMNGIEGKEVIRKITNVGNYRSISTDKGGPYGVPLDKSMKEHFTKFFTVAEGGRRRKSRRARKGRKVTRRRVKSTK